MTLSADEFVRCFLLHVLPPSSHANDVLGARFSEPKATRQGYHQPRRDDGYCGLRVAGAAARRGD